MKRMIPKTPKFDNALGVILEELRPHARICKTCGSEFQIFKEDTEFYAMFRVPPPTLCPLCRKQRRFAHLLRLPKFFKRRCAAPGHTEEVISVYPPGTPHALYDFSYYHSDAWEAAEYGRQYNPSRSFFTRFKELFFATPHVSIDRDPQGVNSDYSVGGLAVKDVYYSAIVYHVENVFYSHTALYSRDIGDCSIVNRSELCYNTVTSTHCHRCVFCVESTLCTDSFFLYECTNCTSCFLSSNLRNKSYVFRNEQLTKEDYEKRIQKINLGDREVFTQYTQEFLALMQKSIHRATANINAVDSLGSRMINCRNVYFGFTLLESENVRYMDNGDYMKDSMDVANSVHSEKLYESVVASGSDILFSMYVRNSLSVEYSSECANCKYCFGCVGLKNKEYHIFNTPYREAEYWKTFDAIKTKMLTDGEYGEFFPMNLGLVPYQTSIAQKYFPLEREEAERRGIPWYDEPVSLLQEGIRIRRAEEVPRNIRDADDSILNNAILCEKTGRPFRMIPKELQFYRQLNVPLPTLHPWERMRARDRLEQGVRLYPFLCPQCGKEKHTVYPPAEQKRLTILCEACYLQSVL